MEISARLLLTSFLLMLVVLSGFAVAQEVIPQIQRLNITIIVNDVSLKLKVYPDGSVQPVYKLDAVIKGFKAEGLKLYYESVKKATSSKYASRSTLDLLLPDSLLQPSVATGLVSRTSVKLTPFELRLVVNARYEYGPGFREKGEIELHLRNETARVSLRGPFEVVLTPRGEFVINASIAAVNVEPEKVEKFARALDKLLENLTRSDLLSSKSIQVRREAGGTVIDVELSGSLAKLVAGLAFIVSPEDVAAITKLLQEDYRIRGEYKLSLIARYKQGEGLQVHMESGGDATGRIERYLIDSARASNALQRILLALLSYALRMHGINLPLSAAYLSNQKPLAEKPPFEAHTKVHAEGEDDSVKLEVEYVGAKLVYAYPTGTPDVDARETLNIITHNIYRESASLRVLELLVPGASSLIPETVKVEGEDGAKVTPQEVAVSQLENTLFTITISEEKTTSTITTTMGTVTSTGAASTGTSVTTSTTRGSTMTSTATTSATSQPTTTSAARSTTTMVTSIGGASGEYTTLIITAVIAALVGAAIAYVLARR